MTDDMISSGINSPSPVDRKIYVGGWGRSWSLRDVIEGELFKTICEAKEVVFTRHGFHEQISQTVEGPQGRLAALRELLEFGSLGMETLEEKDEVLHVTANWNFVG
ncbi:MAG: hypothetical protein AAFO74_16550 [Pseudomonadota bacterium]